MKMREEEKNRSSQWKTFFKKRWVFPAVYLVCAALLISTIVWYQTSTNNAVKDPKVTDNGKDITGKTDEPVIEVNQPFENVGMPVKNDDEVRILTGFFDANASKEQQENALIVDGNKYRPSMGLDIASNDGKEFEVVAALSGKVASVRQDALLGNVIEVEHDKGVVTIYQSVKDIKVQAGDQVKQGDLLATSSTSQINMAAKNHVHFEIRKDNVALNPQTYFGQSLTALTEVDDSDSSGHIKSEEGKDTEDAEKTEDTQSITESELE
ncbi:peptidoglycan DD-metalloendopeptidase family protein [Lederbergia wuyishanensis]|uniref:Stage II sporulation protein Q n=1 Tax=Lederbergia wuyishanensis TaxID=1347903 RepID=A0ABU0D3C0_9BACI|nr:M23 family metallopeptidase [Lederbergia wuyishanensis]MCJ8007934.1 M23 family metallopeptidase [Lederbergia wuyishanensis]MDQ0342899.1 stage II sporulation protein Q [Lederbergia wuyishanensis]